MKSTALHTVYYDWLQEFLSFLREKRFSISPETHIRLIHILENNAERITGENIIDYISPVVAKNAEQAQLLGRAYTEFLEKQFPRIEERPPQGSSSGTARREPGKGKFSKRITWFFLLIGLGAIIVLIRLIIDAPAYPTARASFLLRPPLYINDALQTDGSSGLAVLSDTQYLRFVWNFGDGTIDSSGYLATHRYKKMGKYQVSLKLRALSERIHIEQEDTMGILVVCQPPVFIKINNAQPEIGQPVRCELVYDSMYPPSKKNVWYVDSKPVLKNSFSFSHTFDTAGTYTISFREQDTASRNCFISPVTQVIVTDPGNIFLNISSNKTPPAAPEVFLNRFWLLLLWLGILLPLLLVAWFQWNLRRKEKISAAKAQQITEKFLGTGEPAEIPFRNHDELIQEEKELLDLARRYKQRSSDGFNYLNIPQTIASTIRSEGFLQPVWSSKTKPVEYLVLIDRSKIKNQQVKLFEYLLKRFARNEVYLEKFYYLFDPDICTNAAFPTGISLARLHDLYPNHIVIMLGKGYQLIDRLYPSLREPLVQLFGKWAHWAICTPVSMADWDYREKILQKATFLFPADLKGQLLLFQVLRGEAPYLEELSRLDAYSAREVNMTDAHQLEQYLDEPFLFQWLCAIAVYPRIQWDVLVSIGKALQAAHYPGEEVSYSSLLKLVRISWMQEGSFPDRTRLALLKRLEPRNEKLARETMIRLMDEAAVKTNENSFSFEELQMQRITDKFLLYAHDPGREEYQSYQSAHAEFKTLWEQGLIGDSPLGAYLRKDGGKGEWSTLIGNNTLADRPGAGKPMDAFFKESVQLKRKRTTKASVILSAVSLLSALLLATGLLTAKYISQSPLDRFLRLTHTESSSLIRFRLALNSCPDVSRMQKDSTRFIFVLPGNQVQELNAADTAFSFSAGSLAGTDSLVKITLRSKDAAYHLDTGFKVYSQEMVFGLEGCPVQKPSCGRWVRYTGKFNNAYFLSLFDISIKAGMLPSYRPVFVIGSDGRESSLDGRKALEEYNCEENSGRGKYIFRNPDGTYRVVYSSKEPDASGTDFYLIAFVNKLFATIRDARNDTSKPLFEKKIMSPPVTLIYAVSSSRNIRELSPYQGIWIRGKDSLLINPAANQMTYMKRVWNIKDLKMDHYYDYNLTFCIAQLSDLQRPADKRYLFFCAVNGSKILVNEKMFTQSDMQNKALLPGTLNTFTRSAPLQQKANPPDTTQAVWKQTGLPAYVQEIWQAQNSNNLLRIDLDDGRFYSTTQDKGDYDGSTIFQTYARGDGTYKMICQQGNRYYQYYLKNLSRQSFEFSLCQAEYTSAQEALRADQRGCEQFVRLNLYYKNDEQKIFLPLDYKTYDASQTQKINSYLGTTNQASLPVSIDTVRVYRNAYYANLTGKVNAPFDKQLNAIKANSPLNDFTSVVWTVTNAPVVSNPDPHQLFDRDYIMIHRRSTTSNYPSQTQQPKPIVPKAVFEILWVDDYPQNVQSLADQLQNDSVAVTIVKSNAEALSMLASRSVNLVISDIGRDKEGNKAGLVLLDSIRNKNRNLPFIFYTSSDQKNESANAAMKSGARLVTSNTSELLNFLQKNFGIRINRPKSAN